MDQQSISVQRALGHRVSAPELRVGAPVLFVERPGRVVPGIVLARQATNPMDPRYVVLVHGLTADYRREDVEYGSPTDVGTIYTRD